MYSIEINAQLSSALLITVGLPNWSCQDLHHHRNLQQSQESVLPDTIWPEEVSVACIVTAKCILVNIEWITSLQKLIVWIADTFLELFRSSGKSHAESVTCILSRSLTVMVGVAPQAPITYPSNPHTPVHICYPSVLYRNTEYSIRSLVWSWLRYKYLLEHILDNQFLRFFHRICDKRGL
ncbi:MAG: hypothetical protein U0T81_09545 [Saprospiraceae bacterium]